MASTSCSDLLRRIRLGERIFTQEAFDLGENCPGDFFRIVIESISDSFDARDEAVYRHLMRAWPVPAVKTKPKGDRLYVLSRVTLGADIKIVSMMLDAMKKRFPQKHVVLVGSRKSAELFARDEHLEVNYPRTGPMSARIRFALDLREQLNDGIVVDPDSRISQLGHVPMAAEGAYFHFNSRIAGGASLANLSDLTARWLEDTFGVQGSAYIEPKPVTIETDRPFAAINLGVGENESKRIAGTFERDLIRKISERFGNLFIDLGAGGEEAGRVTEAAEGIPGVRFHQGSFADFASIVQQSSYYAGYDSAGQHAAAAAGIPLTTYFEGAPSLRFASRWRPEGPGRITVVRADCRWDKNDPRFPA